MDIKLTVDTKQLDQWATLAARRLPVGTAFAINHTIDRVRAEKLFPWMRTRLIMRTPQSDLYFYGTRERPDGAAGRFPRASRATAERLWAEFGTDSIVRKGSKGGRILLSGLVTGATRMPVTPGAKRIAIPLEGRPARPNIRRPVPPVFQIANLQLKAYYKGLEIKRRSRARHVRRQGIYDSEGRPSLAGVQGVQFKGLQRTFLLTHTRNAPLGAIFQRFERGRAGIREIYTFVAPFPLPTPLAGYETVVLQAAPPIFREEMEAALQWAFSRENEKAAKALAGSMS